MLKFILGKNFHSFKRRHSKDVYNGTCIRLVYATSPNKVNGLSESFIIDLTIWKWRWLLFDENTRIGVIAKPQSTCMIGYLGL